MVTTQSESTRWVVSKARRGVLVRGKLCGGGAGADTSAVAGDGGEAEWV